MPRTPSDPGWYLGETIAYRPPPAARPPAGAAAETLVAALSEHRAILDALEQATGLAAEFSDFGDLPADVASVAVSRAGEALGEIVPFTAPPRDCPAAAAQIVPLAFAAARLSLVEAEALGPGDMLVLLPGLWQLLPETSAESAAQLGLDPASGRLCSLLANSPTSMEDLPMSDPADNASLTVPVAIHLRETALTQGELDELGRSGAIDLGAVAEGLQVGLSVGGRAFGRGEIVRLGDRFAVLVEDPAAAAGDSSAEAAHDEQGEQAGARQPAPELQGESE